MLCHVNLLCKIISKWVDLINHLVKILLFGFLKDLFSFTLLNLISPRRHTRILDSFALLQDFRINLTKSNIFLNYSIQMTSLINSLRPRLFLFAALCFGIFDLPLLGFKLFLGPFGEVFFHATLYLDFVFGNFFFKVGDSHPAKLFIRILMIFAAVSVGVCELHLDKIINTRRLPKITRIQSTFELPRALIWICQNGRGLFAFWLILLINLQEYAWGCSQLSLLGSLKFCGGLGSLGSIIS